MNNIFNFVNPRYELKTTKKKEKKEYGIDINALVVDDDGSSPLNQPIMDETPKPKRASRKKELVVNATPVNDNPNLMQTNTPYLNTYNETQSLLKGTIYQIDVLSNDVKHEMDAIKASKTIKGKYKYMSDLAMTQGSLISAKISAIREMNKTITDTHNLEMKRAKELNIDNAVDDDKRMMDLYNAFIKTPVQGALPPGYATPLGPSMMDITLPDNNLDITRGVVGSAEETAYQSYLNNITPEQNRMRLERDPNIKTVVVYNQETGARYFDVIDTRTGQSVPNVAKPDDFLLDNMTINVRSGTARNSDANLDFGLIVVGNRGMNDF